MNTVMPMPSDGEPRLSGPHLALLLVGHFALVFISHLRLSVPGDIVAVWPATSFAVAMLWRAPSSLISPGLIGIALSSIAVEWIFGLQPLPAGLVSIVVVFEVAAGLAMLSALDEGKIDRSIMRFLAALGGVGLVVSALGALFGAIVLADFAGRSFWGSWVGWFVGDAAGASLVLPLAASLRRDSVARLTRGRTGLEFLGLIALSATMVVVTLWWLQQPSFLMILPLVLAAMRLGRLAVAVIGLGVLAAILAGADQGYIRLSGSLIGPGLVFAPWLSFGLLVPYCFALLLDELKHERERISERERYFRDAMHHSPFGMALLDPSGRCLSANRALCDLLGYAPHELVGRTPAQISPATDADSVMFRLARLVSGEISEYALEKQFLRKDGAAVWVFIAVSVVRDEVTGKPVHLIAQLQDIEARRRAELALEESESRWNFALESAGQGVWDYDYRRRNTFYSPMWSRMLGYEPGEISSMADAWLSLVHPQDLPRLLRQEHEHLQGATGQFECEFRMRHKDGHWLWILDRGKVIARDETGQPLRMIGTHTDITEHRLLTDALQEEKERLRITLHSIGDGVICTDAVGVVTFMNPIAEALTGWTAASALGKPCSSVFHVVTEETGDPVPCVVSECLSDLSRVNRDEGSILVGRSGGRIDIKVSASPVRKAAGELIGSVLVFQDVTRARTLQKELAHLASHDALTGLQNRTSFEHALAEQCALTAGSTCSHALCFVDLDRFKIINDTAGHAAGDALLREVGRIIREQMRRSDLVARLGGDEFGILLVDCSMDEASRIAENLLERMARVRFSWGRRVYEVGASIGLARLDAETPFAADVMSRADVACYAAKASGRNRISVYHPSEGEAQRHHSELHTAAGIRAALENDRFVVFAQEIRDLRPAGYLQRHAELLVRMRDDDGNLLAPGAFIPAAERYGLMASIDRWMIRQVLHNYDRAILAVPRFAVSINLSANSLEDRGLLTFLAEELDRSALPPHRIRFEITETSLINNIGVAGGLVEDLRAAGYAIMLDDFGAGVSSFSYLERFPADYIKIDGGFVRKLQVNAIDRAIVESINDIGHKIGAITVAEFVEDEETLVALQDIGVDMAQGYHIARPVPLEDLLERLTGEGIPLGEDGRRHVVR